MKIARMSACGQLESWYADAARNILEEFLRVHFSDYSGITLQLGRNRSHRESERLPVIVEQAS
jgi:hypothetical protein